LPRELIHCAQRWGMQQLMPAPDTDCHSVMLHSDWSDRRHCNGARRPEAVKACEWVTMSLLADWTETWFWKSPDVPRAVLREESFNSDASTALQPKNKDIKLSRKDSATVWSALVVFSFLQ
jgi:hypothetical protein